MYIEYYQLYIQTNRVMCPNAVLLQLISQTFCLLTDKIWQWSGKYLDILRPLTVKVSKILISSTLIMSLSTFIGKNQLHTNKWCDNVIFYWHIHSFYNRHSRKLLKYFSFSDDHGSQGDLEQLRLSPEWCHPKHKKIMI